ncbi:hypothetical protein ACA910_016707 [Epithemia clementina (nom. ined.)]
MQAQLVPQPLAYFVCFPEQTKQGVQAMQVVYGPEPKDEQQGADGTVHNDLLLLEQQHDMNLYQLEDSITTTKDRNNNNTTPTAQESNNLRTASTSSCNPATTEDDWCPNNKNNNNNNSKAQQQQLLEV